MKSHIPPVHLTSPLPEGWMNLPAENLTVLQSITDPHFNVITQEHITAELDAAKNYDGKAVAVDDEAIYLNLAHIILMWTNEEIMKKGLLNHGAATMCAYIQAALAADMFRMCGWNNVYVITELPPIVEPPENKGQVCVVFGSSRIQIFNSIIQQVLPALSIVAYEKYQFELHKERVSISRN